MIKTTKNAAGIFVAAINDFSDVGNGDYIEVTKCDVTFQISGTATSVAVVLQRSTQYPGDDGSEGNWAPVDDPMNGDLTAGVNAAVYIESDHAWWRAVVQSVDGGGVTASVSGTRVD